MQSLLESGILTRDRNGQLHTDDVSAVKQWFDSWYTQYKQLPVSEQKSVNTLETLAASLDGLSNHVNYDKSDLRRDLAYSVASCVELVKRTFHPEELDFKARASELGRGEIISRDVSQIASMFLSRDSQAVADSVWDLFSACDDYEKVQREAEQEALQEYYDSEDYVRDQRTMRDLIYEQENIDPKTPYDKLPAYVSDRLYREAGIDTIHDDPLSDEETHEQAPWRAQKQAAIEKAKATADDRPEMGWTQIDGQWITQEQAAKMMREIDVKDFDQLSDETKSMLLLAEQEYDEDLGD